MALAGLETCTALQELAGGLLAGTPLQACGIWGLFSGFVGFVRGFLRLNTGGAWPYRTLCSFFQKSFSNVFPPKCIFLLCCSPVFVSEYFQIFPSAAPPLAT